MAWLRTSWSRPTPRWIARGTKTHVCASVCVPHRQRLRCQALPVGQPGGAAGVPCSRHDQHCPTLSSPLQLAAAARRQLLVHAREAANTALSRVKDRCEARALGTA